DEGSREAATAAGSTSRPQYSSHWPVSGTDPSRSNLQDERSRTPASAAGAARTAPAAIQTRMTASAKLSMRAVMKLSRRRRTPTRLRGCGNILLFRRGTSGSRWIGAVFLEKREGDRRPAL